MFLFKYIWQIFARYLFNQIYMTAIYDPQQGSKYVDNLGQVSHILANTVWGHAMLYLPEEDDQQQYFQQLASKKQAQSACRARGAQSALKYLEQLKLEYSWKSFGSEAWASGVDRLLDEISLNYPLGVLCRAQLSEYLQKIGFWALL